MEAMRAGDSVAPFDVRPWRRRALARLAENL